MPQPSKPKPAGPQSMFSRVMAKKYTPYIGVGGALGALGGYAAQRQGWVDQSPGASSLTGGLLGSALGLGAYASTRIPTWAALPAAAGLGYFALNGPKEPGKR